MKDARAAMIPNMIFAILMCWFGSWLRLKDKTCSSQVVGCCVQDKLMVPFIKARYIHTDQTGDGRRQGGGFRSFIFCFHLVLVGSITESEVM